MFQLFPRGRAWWFHNFRACVSWSIFTLMDDEEPHRSFVRSSRCRPAKMWTIRTWHSLRLGCKNNNNNNTRLQMVVMVSTVQWSEKVNDFAVKPFKNRPHFQLEGKAPPQGSQRGRNPLERGTKDERDAGAEGHTAPVVEIVSTQPGLV